VTYKKEYFKKLDVEIIGNPNEYTTAEYNRARNAIITAYMPIIWAKAQSLSKQSPTDIEELITAGIMAVIRGFEKYDYTITRDGRQSKITSFIFRYLYNSFYTVIRRHQMKKRKCKSICSLNQTIGESEEEWIALLDGNDTGYQEMISRDYIEYIKRHITAEEAKLIDAFLATSSNADMCKKLGVSEDWGRVRRLRLWKKLRWLFKHNKINRNGDNE